MATPTTGEHEAFLWMQGRMVELLLRHDVRRFGATFGDRSAVAPDDPRLTPYRDLAAHYTLRDDLFDAILPRIKRRLSFVAPREVLVEDLPPRGRIDWPRTIAAGLRDRPGEPALAVHTRQRRRHFATPENLLTVATVLAYRAGVQRLLDAEAAAAGASAFRHPLQEIVDACGRELVFPQFAGIVREARAIVEQGAPVTPEDLEAEVAGNLLPGRNSAYDDLIAWRARIRALRLIQRSPDEALPPQLGADPARDNYLYQIWLFYEIADLLDRDRRILAWDGRRMALTFTWGHGEDAVTYVLQHDRGLAQHWQHAPGVRPDLYMYRAGRESVRDGDQLIWREPGYVLDAKYYRPSDSARAPASPVKRMVADLHLTGERHGALLFAFQQGGAEDGERPDPAGVAVAGDGAAPGDAVVVEPDDASGALTDAAVIAVPDRPQPAPSASPIYRISPQPDTAHAILRDVRIGIWRIQPQIAPGSRDLTGTLTALLQAIHEALKQPPP